MTGRYVRLYRKKSRVYTHKSRNRDLEGVHPQHLYVQEFSTTSKGLLRWKTLDSRTFREPKCRLFTLIVHWFIDHVRPLLL